MARPTKFTKPRRDKILEAIEYGATYDLAADLAGVDRNTLYYWLRKAREPGVDKAYKTFLNDIKQARAKCALHDLKTIHQETLQGNWKCAAWRLERRFEYRKDSPVETLEEAIQEEETKPGALDPISILTRQANELQAAIVKAEKSESWQAYAALQRQLLQTSLQLKSLQDGGDITQGLTDTEILAEITNIVATLPPAIKQELINDILDLHGNIYSIKTR